MTKSDETAVNGCIRSAAGVSGALLTTYYLLLTALSRGYRRQSGVTLLELIVALAILALGLLPIVTALNRLQMNVYQLGTIDEAAQLASARIEQLRAFGFDNLETDSMAGVVSPPPFNEGKISGPYSRSTVLTYQTQNADGTFATAAAAPSDFIKITATITWRVDRNSRTYNSSGVIARMGTNR